MRKRFKEKKKNKNIQYCSTWVNMGKHCYTFYLKKKIIVRVLCNSKRLIRAWLAMLSLLLKPTMNVTKGDFIHKE